MRSRCSRCAVATKCGRSAVITQLERGMFDMYMYAAEQHKEHKMDSELAKRLPMARITIALAANDISRRARTDIANANANDSERIIARARADIVKLTNLDDATLENIARATVDLDDTNARADQTGAASLGVQAEVKAPSREAASALALREANSVGPGC